jgi:hypothetical protein
VALEQRVIDESVGNAHGDLDKVREIVHRHPEVINARATWNETPIEAAAQTGHRPLIDLLLECGAPVDFYTACVLGRADRVRAELAAHPAGRPHWASTSWPRSTSPRSAAASR